MYGIRKYFLVLLLFCSYSAFSQTVSTDSVKQRRVEVGISVFYYHPILSDLNKGFSEAEINSGIRTWKDFDISYMVLSTFGYRFNRWNQFALQAGGSYLMHKRDIHKSYYYLLMFGGEYRFIPISRTRPTSDFWVSLGGGMIITEFYRSYDHNTSMYAFGSKYYVDAGVGIRVAVTQNVGINFDLRYMFVPPMKFDNLGSELKLNSFLGGIGFVVSL